MTIEKARTLTRGDRDNLGELVRRLSDTLTARGQRAFKAAVLDAASGDATLGWEAMTIHTKELFSIYEQAFRRAGRAESAILGQFDIDLTNTRVIRHLRNRSANLVTQIDETSKGAIRTVLSRGAANGLQPEQLASRIGRVVGLTPRDALAVENMQRGLLKQGINPRRVERMAQTYAKKLLDARALVIARTEVIDAIESARQEVWEQAVAAGLVLSKDIWREWVKQDEEACPVCTALDGARSRLGGAFRKGGQSAQRPPAHPNCRCRVRYHVRGLRVQKHAGPGPHPGTGTGQEVHGGGAERKKAFNPLNQNVEATIGEWKSKGWHSTGAADLIEENGFNPDVGVPGALGLSGVYVSIGESGYAFQTESHQRFNPTFEVGVNMNAVVLKRSDGWGGANDSGENRFISKDELKKVLVWNFGEPKQTPEFIAGRPGWAERNPEWGWWWAMGKNLRNQGIDGIVWDFEGEDDWGGEWGSQVVVTNTEAISINRRYEGLERIEKKRPALVFTWADLVEMLLGGVRKHGQGSHDDKDHGNWADGGVRPMADVRRNYNIDQWNDFFEGPAEELAAVKVMVDGVGYQTVVTDSMFQSRRLYDTLSVEGVIMPSAKMNEGDQYDRYEREAVGRWIRTFRSDGTVYMESFFVDESARGKGLGYSLMEKWEIDFAKAGFTMSEVNAIDTGRYAWAKWGYGFDIGGHSRLDGAISTYAVDKSSKHHETAKYIIDTWGDKYEPWDIAYTTGGKELLLDSPGWTGFRLLPDVKKGKDFYHWMMNEINGDFAKLENDDPEFVAAARRYLGIKY